MRTNGYLHHKALAPACAFPKGFIFDLDGTLVNSSKIHDIKWVRVFRDFGWDITLQQAESVRGMAIPKIIQMLAAVAVPNREDPVAVDFDTMFAYEKELYVKLLQSNKHPKELATDGSDIFLQFAHAKSICIVSNSDIKTVGITLAATRHDKFFNDPSKIITPDQGFKDKPHPEMILTALARSGFQPRETAYFGDTKFDLDACVAANVPCYGIAAHVLERQKDDMERHFMQNGAIAVFKDFCEALHYFNRPGLPTTLQPIGVNPS